MSFRSSSSDFLCLLFPLHCSGSCVLWNDRHTWIKLDLVPSKWPLMAQLISTFHVGRLRWKCSIVVSRERESGACEQDKYGDGVEGEKLIHLNRTIDNNKPVPILLVLFYWNVLELFSSVFPWLIRIVVTTGLLLLSKQRFHCGQLITEIY